MGREVALEALSSIYEVLLRGYGEAGRFSGPDRVSDLLEMASWGFAEAQREGLGVSVLGFVAVNLKERRLRRLFEGRREEEGHQTFTLPYAWGEGDRSYDSLLNWLFGVWREQEDLGTEQQGLDLGKYPPEFLFCLPHGGDMVDESAIPMTSREAILAQCRLAATLRLHYVPAGEVLFFLLLWRILLRLSATETGIADLYAVLSEPMCASPAGDVFLWSAAEATGLLSPRERAVLSAVDDVEAPFIEQMWDIATDGDRSGPEPVSTLSELEKLGVVAEDPSNGGRWLLQEEFSYLSAFLEHLSASSQLKKEVAAFLGTVAGKGFLDLKSGARFVQLLLDCFSHLVTGETCKTSAALLDEPLSSLHGFARFPVIPYYYWSSIDRAVKSHLVLPILESPLEKIPIHSARGSGGPNALPGFSSAYDSLPTTMSGVTLVAVLGVRPIRCLDYTMLCASGAEGTDDSGDAMRLMCIRDFAVTMGRVVADDVTAGG